MPDLDDFMLLADSLGEQRVYISKNRCCMVKNRHSSCSRCADVCPTSAITLEANSVTVANAQCVGCGACTTVCPTEALIPLDPTDQELEDAVVKLRKRTGSTLYFACSRMAARNQADPDLFVELPCLARMEESLLLRQILDGVDRIVLIDGNCSNCKFQLVGPIVQMVASTTNDLLKARGNGVRVERMSEFPPELVRESQGVDRGAERRAVMTDSARSMKGALGKAIGILAQAEASKNTTSATVLGAMGLVGRRAPKAIDPEMHRQTDLVDALYELGETEDAQVATRFFGAFAHDPEKCRKCGVCARVCPTRALIQKRIRNDGNTRVYLEFSASECVQCRLCEDICFRECISVSPIVSLADVFSFEPQKVPCFRDE